MPTWRVTCHAVWERQVTDALTSEGIEVHRAGDSRYQLLLDADDETAALTRVREVAESAGGNASSCEVVRKSRA